MSDATALAFVLNVSIILLFKLYVGLVLLLKLYVAFAFLLIIQSRFGVEWIRSYESTYRLGLAGNP